MVTGTGWVGECLLVSGDVVACIARLQLDGSEPVAAAAAGG